MMRLWLVALHPLLTSAAAIQGQLHGWSNRIMSREPDQKSLKQDQTHDAIVFSLLGICAKRFGPINLDRSDR